MRNVTHSRTVTLTGLTLATAIFLVGCTGAEGNSSAAPLSRTEARSYVDMLRGENDLAHSSLEIPSSATLAGVSSIVTAQEYAGLTRLSLSADELAQLATRSPEDTAAKFAQLCVLTDGDSQKAQSALDPKDRDAVESFEINDTKVTSPNDAIELADTVGAITCRDAAKPPINNKLARAAQSAVADFPLPFVILQRDGLISESASPQLTDSEASALDAALEKDGCTDWAQALSAAGRSASSSPAQVACADSRTTELADPTTLTYFVAAGIAPDIITELLEANSAAVDRWTRVEPDFANASTAPRGLGTLGATRDAISLLRLTGAGKPPGWMRNGLATFAVSEEALQDAAGESAPDILFLCTQFKDVCAVGISTAASTTVSARLEKLGANPPDDDLLTARLIESAAEAGLSLPVCSQEIVDGWLPTAPLSLATLALSQKECWEMADASSDELLDKALQRLKSTDFQASVGYLILRTLRSSGAPEPEAAREVLSAYDNLIAKLDESEGDGYFNRARPLSLELLRAQLQNWTS